MGTIEIEAMRYQFDNKGKDSEIVVSFLEDNIPILIGKKWVYDEPYIIEIDADWLGERPITIELVHQRMKDVENWRSRLKAAITLFENGGGSVDL
jgi:hypothetical protein